MQLDANILLQNIRQDHFYLHIFVRELRISLLEVGYCFICLEILFLDESF